MTRKNQHVVPHPDDWAVRGAGNQHSELVIYRPNGQIHDKGSRGHAPNPSKG